MLRRLINGLATVIVAILIGVGLLSAPPLVVVLWPVIATIWAIIRVVDNFGDTDDWWRFPLVIAAAIGGAVLSTLWIIEMCELAQRLEIVW